MSLPYYVDPIYPSKKIPITREWTRTVMNHPMFQRLRHIGQTACADYLFISHRHSRYEHSLGTGYLASLVCENFDIDEKLKNKVMFAAMCHDLGHGPFSHSLEYFVLPKLDIHDFCHEDYSVEIAHRIYKDIKNPDFDIEDLKEILNNGGKNLDNKIFHLISNKSFGVDVDRADYMLRDSFLLGIDLNLQVEELFKGIVLEKGLNGKSYTLALKAEVIPLFHHFIESRYLMFHHMYSQPLATGRNLLIARLLYESESSINLAKRLRNLEDFLEMDDHIIKEAYKCKGINQSLDQIIDLAEHNQGYHFCVEFEISDSDMPSRNPKAMVEYTHRLKEDILGSEFKYKNDVEFYFARIDSFKDLDYSNILIRDDKSVFKLPEYLDKTNIPPLTRKVFQRFRVFVLKEEMVDPVLIKVNAYLEREGFKISNVNYDPTIYDIYKATGME